MDSKLRALPGRVTSIDALRGLVMFTMIFVNYLAGAGSIVPDWMVHFSGLISNLLPPALNLLGQDWFWRILQSGFVAAIVTSAAGGVLILGASAGLNRLGFTLRL